MKFIWSLRRSRSRGRSCIPARDCSASDCAERLSQAWISHLQRFPASITRGTIRRLRRSRLADSVVSRWRDRPKRSLDSRDAGSRSWLMFYVFVLEEEDERHTAAFRNRSLNLWALIVTQCAHGWAGLRNSKGPLVPRRPRQPTGLADHCRWDKADAMARCGTQSVRQNRRDCRGIRSRYAVFAVPVRGGSRARQHSRRARFPPPSQIQQEAL